MNKLSTIRYASVRLYIQEGGVTWRAVATVERAGEDGKIETRTEFGSNQTTPAEALADALGLVDFMDPE